MLPCPLPHCANVPSAPAVRIVRMEDLGQTETGFRRLLEIETGEKEVGKRSCEEFQ